MLACANFVEFTGSQRQQQTWPSRSTFSWKELARTLKPVLGFVFSFPTMACHYQAISFSTSPAPSHQGPQRWVCLRTKLRSLSSRGFCLRLSRYFTWPICLPQQKLRNKFQLVSLFLLYGHQLFHCYLKNRALWTELGKGIIHLSNPYQGSTHVISWGLVCIPSPKQKHGIEAGSSLS